MQEYGFGNVVSSARSSSFLTSFKVVSYWGKRKKFEMLGTNIKRGIKLLCQNVASVSVDKYHPFPARDGEVFKK